MALSLIAKVALGVVAGGAVGTAVAVPAIMATSSGGATLILPNTPEQYKQHCREMVKDKSSEKYLLVCDIAGMKSEPTFYFLEKDKNLIGVEEISKVQQKESDFELSLQLIRENSNTPSSSMPKESTILASSDWTDLQGVKLGSECNFKEEEVNEPWKITCPMKGKTGEKEISLTSLAFSN